MIKGNWLLKTTSITLSLLIVSSCSSSDVKSNAENTKNIKQKSEGPNWNDNNSLIQEIRTVLKENCENLVLNKEQIELQYDLPEDNLKIFLIDSAQIFLYKDGAIEPNIEDENATVKYYETWKCKSDTLYISQLQNPENSEVSSASAVKVSDCGYGYSLKPKSLTLTCADGGVQLEEITWTSWNEIEASGFGVLVENTCDPDCASGNYIRQEATFTLGSVLTDSKGTKIFTEIAVQTKEKQVSGAYLDTFMLSYEP